MMDNIIRDAAVDVMTGTADVVDAGLVVAHRWAETFDSTNMQYIGRIEDATSFSSVDAVGANVLSIGEELATQLLLMDDSDTDDFREFKRRLGY